MKKTINEVFSVFYTNESVSLTQKAIAVSFVVLMGLIGVGMVINNL